MGLGRDRVSIDNTNSETSVSEWGPFDLHLWAVKKNIEQNEGQQ